MTVDLSATITSLYPGALWALRDEDYATLTWHESNVAPKPTLAELKAAWPAVRDARKWDAVRVERDRLLAACDWTQVADAPVDAAAWAAYRQQLRDIPQTFDDPDQVVWPEEP